MRNYMGYLMLAFIGTILVSLFYWHVVRPVFMQAIRYRLFARRDNLRSLAINGSEDCQSFSYSYLEEFINKTIGYVPSIGFVSFLMYSFVERDSPNNETNIRFQTEASKELSDIRDKTIQDALMMMTFNSPIMVIIAIMIAMVLWVSGKINKMMVLNRTERFVGNLSPA